LHKRHPLHFFSSISMIKFLSSFNLTEIAFVGQISSHKLQPIQSSALAKIRMICLSAFFSISFSTVRIYSTKIKHQEKLLWVRKSKNYYLPLVIVDSTETKSLQLYVLPYIKSLCCILDITLFYCSIRH